MNAIQQIADFLMFNATSEKSTDDNGTITYVLGDFKTVLYIDGSIEFYKRGVLHRVDGPAVITSAGLQSYYHSGLLHNSRGAAVVSESGAQQFYINGIKIQEDEFYTTLTQVPNAE